MTDVARLPEPAPGYPSYPTILHALAAAAKLRPDAPGIVCQDRELTYGQYAQVVGALARRFGAMGAAGERIAFMSANSLEAAVGLLAGMAALAGLAGRPRSASGSAEATV